MHVQCQGPVAIDLNLYLILYADIAVQSVCTQLATINCMAAGA